MNLEAGGQQKPKTMYGSSNVSLKQEDHAMVGNDHQKWAIEERLKEHVLV